MIAIDGATETSVQDYYSEYTVKEYLLRSTQIECCILCFVSNHLHKIVHKWISNKAVNAEFCLLERANYFLSLK